MSKRNESRFKRTEALIRAGKYEDARKLLQSMKNDPTALRHLATLNELHPPKKQLSVLARIGLAAGVLFVFVIVLPSLFESPEARTARNLTLTAQANSIRQETSAPTSDSPSVIITASESSVDSSPTEVSLTAEARLEQAIAASGGIQRVNLVSVVGNDPVIVHVEMLVHPPYNTIAVADMVFRQAMAVTNSAALDFTVIIDDGILPVSYRWDNENDQFVSTELSQSAPAIASMIAISTASPFPTMPSAQMSTQPAVIPTRFLFTCNQSDDLNCPDFMRTGASADEHLRRCGDEDRLDGDNDGDACEPEWD